MRRKRLIWQIYPAFLFVTLFLVLAVTWYASRSLRLFYLDEIAHDLESRAVLFRSQIDLPVTPDDIQTIDARCNELGRESQTRITVILPNGVVVGDSDEDPLAMEDHSDRPEIIEAMTGRTGRSLRYSATLKTHMMYIAIPITTGRETVAVVRTAIPTSAIDDALRSIYGRIALGGVVLAVFVAIVSLFLSKRITRPLVDLRRAAERFARGNLATPLDVPDSEEFGSLAIAMNKMAEQLDLRLLEMVEQRNEQQAVLESMVESVLAIDSDERIISVNLAAARLFDVDPDEVAGRPLQEIIRNPELQKLAAETWSSDAPVEGEIVIYRTEERVLQVHGTPLRDSQDAHIGALIVLNDITRLRRLEIVRRDFVANVSHELKTPITSIKGFVETLLGGAMDDREALERFLGIIAKHSERLDAIIEDLLALSRLEQDTEREEIEIRRLDIVAVVRSAIDACKPRAQSRDIELKCVNDTSVEGRANSQLLEHAITNLIDNAVKYSDPGKTIEIAATRTDGGVDVSVRDRGWGIERRHLPRLFERFYRTDRARSREMGGTGLGLAIVKHIARVHGGRVEVESSLGEGSVFTVFLPDDDRGAYRGS
ncbi:MAG: PAS domain-containing protein [Candidatus Latescibacterota bacterium]|nr:MAG: PAS domain-containing protein [Candidatus Latescibacterota bacterium]